MAPEILHICILLFLLYIFIAKIYRSVAFNPTSQLPTEMRLFSYIIFNNLSNCLRFVLIVHKSQIPVRGRAMNFLF